MVLNTLMPSNLAGKLILDHNDRSLYYYSYKDNKEVEAELSYDYSHWFCRADSAAGRLPPPEKEAVHFGTKDC